jgi:Putative metallopeptidase
VARSVQLLEVVAAGAAEELAWPAPFALEMQTCDFPNARWDLSTHKLTLCYALVAEFEDLYRDYGEVRADGSTVAYSAKRKSTSLPAAFKASQTPRKRK